METLVKHATKVISLFDDVTDPEKYRRNLMKVVVYFEEFEYEETLEKPAYLVSYSVCILQYCLPVNIYCDYLNEVQSSVLVELDGYYIGV